MCSESGEGVSGPSSLPRVVDAQHHPPLLTGGGSPVFPSCSMTRLCPWPTMIQWVQWTCGECSKIFQNFPAPTRTQRVGGRLASVGCHRWVLWSVKSKQIYPSHGSRRIFFAPLFFDRGKAVWKFNRNPGMGTARHALEIATNPSRPSHRRRLFGRGYVFVRMDFSIIVVPFSAGIVLNGRVVVVGCPGDA